MIGWLSATLGLAMFAPQTEQIVTKSWKETQVVGHRGAAAYSRENTLPSFRAAISSGAAVTECDVRISADGVPMVIHDSTLNRTTALKGEVAETASSEMIFAGVPTLEQVCAEVKGKIILAVDIKAGAEAVEPVLSVLRQAEMIRECMIFSSSEAVVAGFEESEPDIYSVWLCGEAFEGDDFSRLDAGLDAAHADGVGFSYANVKVAAISHLQQRHTAVFVWTVPPGGLAKQLSGMGVNFLITNHPNEVLLELRRQ